MKKTIALCLALILAFSIVSCTSNTAESYKLTIGNGQDLLYEQPAEQYQVGETVTIKVDALTDVDIECFVNGESIGKQTAVTDEKYGHWEYYFKMPAEEVIITLKIISGEW